MAFDCRAVCDCEGPTSDLCGKNDDGSTKFQEEEAVEPLPLEAPAEGATETSSPTPVPEELTYEQLIDKNLSLPTYTIDDALNVTHVFDHTYMFLVYDPGTDMFRGMFPKHFPWFRGRAKLMNSFRDVSYMLREIFPERFQGAGSDEIGKFLKHSTLIATDRHFPILLDAAFSHYFLFNIILNSHTHELGRLPWS